MNSWRECKLGEIATYRTGKLNSNASTENGKYPFFTCSPITAKIDNYAFDEEALLLAGNNANGIFSLKYYKGKFNAYQRTYLINTKEDYKFLFYCLKLQLANLVHISQGTATKFLTLPILNNIDISLPPLEEQKAIAEVLSSLDDKIDLLHRQNQTLESLAQTLFRQWFIEEAKEEWEEKPLGEIALHVKSNINPANFQNKSFLHFSLPTFDEGQRPKKELGSEILSNKYQVIKNSILVSKLNPRTPRIWLIDGNINEDISICSTEFQVLKPKENIWRGFIYCFLKTEQAIQELAGASSGTSGSHQRVKPEDIFNLTFQYPDMDTLKKFDELSSDYWRKIKVNQKQIQTLENLRDTLLPKLLSGELVVSE